MEWQPIATAPQDGTLVELKGKFPMCDEVVEIVGHYVAEYTDGWETEKGSWFFPTHWRRLTKPKFPKSELIAEPTILGELKLWFFGKN